ncbi:MAG: hypothetical protein QOG62_848 [Thermoleophilaceae bacterium]|jgi:uncharacterized protein YbjT (DUF2867 family)|nr:hypothetical protein [Thermoleophilaceae bacterium]
MELIVGATGYVGGLVADRLSRDGRAARALARDPSRLPDRPGVSPVKADLLAGRGLKRALDGCHTAYYLAHSMERPGDDSPGDFADRERRSAERFGKAAAAAGLERVVYLGGFAPPEGAGLSPHLSSRLEVERILLEAVPGSTAMRASILIGAGSASFQMLVRLVENMRFLPMPAWHANHTQPIDERDAVEYLVRTPATPAAAGLSLDIAGPDVLAYGEMIEEIAELMGVGRTSIPLPVSQTPTASAVVARIVGQPLELVRPLMESLGHELLPRDDSAARIYGMRPRPFSRAVEHALGQWEAREPLAAR